MNRRTFLKSIATVCGTVVVCPGELVKDESEKVLQVPWVHYYTSYSYTIYDEFALVTEFEKEFWNTEFKSPLIIGAYDEKIQTPHRPNPLRS